ncbi:MAG: GNAT family N-acetyltransferase [Patescibacteria group bacterium]
MDVRQSEGWTEYLKMYDWKLLKLTKGSVIRLKPTFLGTIAKLQRPTQLINSDLNEIDNLCKENKVALLKLEPNIDQNINLIKEHAFVKIGCPYLATKTLCINLKKEEKELWNDLAHNARRSIKRSKTAGVKVVEVSTNKPELKKFYGVLRDAGRKKGFYVQSFNELKNKSEAFNHNAHLLNAYDKNGNLCSSQFYLAFNNNAWSLHGATTEEGKKNNAGYLLLWKAILLFKQMGYGSVDLEGLYDERYPRFTKNWDSFSSYKRKFGGEVVTFPETYTKFFSNPFKWLSALGFSI